MCEKHLMVKIVSFCNDTFKTIFLCIIFKWYRSANHGALKKQLVHFFTYLITWCSINTGSFFLFYKSNSAILCCSKYTSWATLLLSFLYLHHWWQINFIRWRLCNKFIPLKTYYFITYFSSSRKYYLLLFLIANLF